MLYLKKISLAFLFLLVSFSSMAQYDKDFLLNRGRHSLSEGRYSSAILDFNKLIQIDDYLYEAYFFRGIAKYNLGDLLGANDDFNSTIILNPLYTSAYHYRAITLSRVGKYNEALGDFERALKLQPSFYDLYFSRGVTYLLSQRFEDAINDFDKFLLHNSRSNEAYLNRGASYLYLGDTLKAMSDYNKAISVNFFEAESYIRRSNLLNLQGRKEEAIKDLDMAIMLDPSSTYAYFNRSIIKYEQKDIDGAFSDLDKVLESEPNNSLSLYNRALMNSQIGKYGDALNDYNKVLAINPSNVLTYYNRAAVYIELQRYEEAMRDYSTAIELYPDFSNAYLNRSYVKNQLGLYASAKEDYNIAQQKVKAYNSNTKGSNSDFSFADTTKKYDHLLALDADFAKKQFNDELLQYRNVDLKLKPLFEFVLSESEGRYLALQKNYESKELRDFMQSIPIFVTLSPGEQQKNTSFAKAQLVDRLRDDIASKEASALDYFAMALLMAEDKQFNTALEQYNLAIDKDPNNAFLYFNRGVLKSETIDFISTMSNNVRTLSLNSKSTTNVQVDNSISQNYDYSEAIADMLEVIKLYPEFPYSYYNLGNMYSHSKDFLTAIQYYTQALYYHTNIGEAYYNRGLILIYLKDQEKGCIDLSKAGELGVGDAYSAIKRYCTK